MDLNVVARLLMQPLIMIISILLVAQSAQALLLSPTYYIDGVLYDRQGHLVTTSVTFTVQIINDSGTASSTCVLYEEEPTMKDLFLSQGEFQLPLGLGRSPNDSGLSMSKIYANTGETLTGLYDITGAPGCSYTSSEAAKRKLRLKVDDGRQIDHLVFDIGSVPNALVAESLQGYRPQNFIHINDARNVTQNNLEDVFDGTGFVELLALINGTSSNYTKIATNGAVPLPPFTTSSPPTSRTAGDMWYDSSTNEVKFYNGSQIQALRSDSPSASSVTFAPTGAVSATNVQDAINELDSDKQGANAELTGLSGLSTTGFLERTGAGTYSAFAVPLAARDLLDDTSHSAQRTTLGLGSAATLSVGDSNGEIPTWGASPTAGALVRWNRTSTGIETVDCSDGQYLRRTSSDWQCENIVHQDNNAFHQGGDILGALAILGTQDAQDLSFITNNTEAARITSGGNLGIGVSTPMHKLSVHSGTEAVAASYLSDINEIKIRFSNNSGEEAHIGNLNGNLKLEPHTGRSVNVSNSRITNVATPSQAGDAVNKAYVDDVVVAKLNASITVINVSVSTHKINFTPSYQSTSLWDSTSKSFNSGARPGLYQVSANIRLSNLSNSGGKSTIELVVDDGTGNLSHFLDYEVILGDYSGGAVLTIGLTGSMLLELDGSSSISIYLQKSGNIAFTVDPKSNLSIQRVRPL